jgi:hypothetical protein|nr:MAG TPA_asm: hypothetical protein [Caudoviricetes sp.]
MIKYRLHNITDFGVEIHDFHTENSLNNYIALFVDEPYWVENLYTNKNIYVGFDGHSYANPSDGIKDYIETVSPNKPDVNNVSRETLHESEIDWIKRHTPTEEKEPYTKLEKISSFLGILSVIIMATFLLYLFLSSVSFIAEHFSDFTWKLFNIL